MASKPNDYSQTERAELLGVIARLSLENDLLSAKVLEMRQYVHEATMARQSLSLWARIKRRVNGL